MAPGAVIRTNQSPLHAHSREAERTPQQDPMSQTRNSRNQPSAEEPGADGQPRRSGRYRYSGGQPVDPDAGVHPEMRAEAVEAAHAADATQRSSPAHASPEEAAARIPTSPAELLAMQDKPSSARDEKPERQESAKVRQVMELIDQLDTKAAEDLEIAFRLVRRLESFHDDVVNEMRDDEEASHNQLICWAIDADRLMQARILLGNVDLE
ncbi:MAG: hypothetical protein VKI42_07690 [Synechococcaceae cyanobacterium]|nr:hypothetical protein [Synechococcaceae cyanobacterium]